MGFQTRAFVFVITIVILIAVGLENFHYDSDHRSRVWKPALRSEENVSKAARTPQPFQLSTDRNFARYLVMTGDDSIVNERN